MKICLDSSQSTFSRFIFHLMGCVCKNCTIPVVMTPHLAQLNRRYRLAFLVIDSEINVFYDIFSFFFCL